MSNLFAEHAAQRKRSRLRVAARALAVACLTAALGGVMGFFLIRRLETAMTFHPVAFDGGATWKLPDGGEDVWFTTADGLRLHGWFVRSRGESPATATVVYFHGNGGNLSNVGWRASSLAARGFDVLLFDYRGYGRSEGTPTDERGLFADADAAYDYVVSERKASPARLVLYGQSLGTTAVADVASRRPCGAVVLESGLSSASDMAVAIFPWLPRRVHAVLTNRLDSATKVANIRCPVLVAHGARDRTIPVEQGRKLYAAAREPKRLIVLPEAGHNDMAVVGGTEYLNATVQFIEDALREGER